MKRLSGRGLFTIMITAFIVICVSLIIVINHVQDVHSQQWQKEHVGIINE